MYSWKLIRNDGAFTLKSSPLRINDILRRIWHNMNEIKYWPSLIRSPKSVHHAPRWRAKGCVCVWRMGNVYAYVSDVCVSSRVRANRLGVHGPTSMKKEANLHINSYLFSAKIWFCINDFIRFGLAPNTHTKRTRTHTHNRERTTITDFQSRWTTIILVTPCQAIHLVFRSLPNPKPVKNEKSARHRMKIENVRKANASPHIRLIYCNETSGHDANPLRVKWDQQLHSSSIYLGLLTLIHRVIRFRLFSIR